MMEGRGGLTVKSYETEWIMECEASNEDSRVSSACSVGALMCPFCFLFQGFPCLLSAWLGHSLIQDFTFACLSAFRCFDGCKVVNKSL
mmetsp:Transcript_40772/g.105795  ORF Transcript_40772/g.105795 Transcript_40772/m.105795 type:complete len:88 (-) Transcript_40772:26-289(-)